MKTKVKLNNYENKTIKISGSKNSSLPIIAASLLCDEEVILNNIPNISDVLIFIKIIKKIGYDIRFINNTVIVKPSSIKMKKFHFKEIKRLRGSYYLIGALIGISHYNDFSFSLPGGCNFDNRPINFHLDAFNKLGVNCVLNKNKIDIKGYKSSCIYTMPFPSVGATINMILACCKTENETIITNASIEPEVIDVCNFLKSMGVTITIKNRIISIIGKKYLHKTYYTVMSDRIEAGTFLILGAMHNGISINNFDYKSLIPLINLLKNIGCTITINNNIITLIKNDKLKPFNISLDPFPGMPTDLGPLLCVLAACIDGESVIIDNVYHNRLSHIKELNKMNINIYHENNKIIIRGGNRILNGTVKAHDLRCAACLVLAASLCDEYSKIKSIDYLFRGYENIKYKLTNLGINFV